MDSLTTLGKTNYIGKDGFHWWIGQVAPPESWRGINAYVSRKGYAQNRCKVRIIGYHPFDEEGNVLPDDDLPWAELMLDPRVGSGQAQLNETSVLAGGEICIGFFLDGEDAQQPVIMGLLPKFDEIPDEISNEEIDSVKSSGFRAFSADLQSSARSPGNHMLSQLLPKQPLGNQQVDEDGTLKITVIGNPEEVEGSGDDTSSEIESSEDEFRANEGEKVNKRFNQFQKVKLDKSNKNSRKCPVHDGKGGLVKGGATASCKFEEDNTKTTTHFNPCDDSAIGKINNLLGDFLKVARTYERIEDSFIDPLTNMIVDMDSELEYLQQQTSGFVKGMINEIKSSFLKGLNKKFKKFLSKQKKNASKSFFKDKSVKKGFSSIMNIINCAFGAALAGLGGFLKNMFKNLLNKTLNAAVCAIEQLTAGIFAKIFDTLEGALGTVMSGLNWLVGGLGSVSKALRGASSLAKKILDFIGCILPECEKPTTYRTGTGTKTQAETNFEELTKKANVISGLGESIANKRKDVKQGIKNIFAPSEVKAYAADNNISIAEAENILAGGSNETVIDGSGVGQTTLVPNPNEPEKEAIDEAIDKLSIFGDEDLLFADCTEKSNNPNTQDDLTPMRPGFIYPKCIPPDYQVNGSGSGAELLIVVGNDRRIFSVEVINGGRGYDNDTTITIIDNTGNGTGANVIPIVKDGVIVETVILSTGFGYCLNTTGIGSDPIGADVTGTLKDVYISRPGYGYDPNDTITFDDITNIPIITTPSGGIIGVNFPSDLTTEFSTRPVLKVNTTTGFGSKLIPIMSFKGQLKTDVGAEDRKKLIGIEQVIDCIGDKTELVGYVNGVPYYGPFHFHPSRGVKMVGAQHVDYPHEIIYDTMEESLGQPPVVSRSSSVTNTETTETPETTTPVDTTPTIVTEQTISTPTTPTTTTDTSSSSSGSTPPSTPPSSPPSGGGYGGY